MKKPYISIKKVGLSDLAAGHSKLPDTLEIVNMAPVINTLITSMGPHLWLVTDVTVY